MIEISVIMLIHNRENYVGQAIESILNQTFSNFEFIIINNCSTDRSLEIAQQYQKKDSRIKIYDSETENIGAGRNLGLKKAKGRYFTFMDDDDYCFPNYLEFLHELAEEYQADISVCGSYYDFEGELTAKYVYEDLLLYNKEEAITDFLLRKHINNANPTKLFRCTDRIRNIVYDEKSKYDDIHTMYKYFCATSEKEIVVVGKGTPLYCFRRHDRNNSTATIKFQNLTPEWIKEYLDVYKMRTAYIKQLVPRLGNLAQWCEWSYMISMVEKINRFKLLDCADELRYMVQELRENKEYFLNAIWTQDYEKEWMEKYI